MTIPVTRLALRMRPDLQRLITKPYIPADHRPLEERTRLQHMLDRILAMEPGDAERTLQSVTERFADRHDDFEGVLSRGFSAVAHSIADPAGLSDDVRRLIGAYFMQLKFDQKILTFIATVPMLFGSILALGLLMEYFSSAT